MSNHRLFRLIARGLGTSRAVPRPPNAAEVHRRQPIPTEAGPEQRPPEPTITDSSRSIYCASPDLFATGRVPLRIVGPSGRITMLETLVTYVGHATFEIRLNGTVIGSIRRTNRSFAARAVQRTGQPRECPKCLLWDEAARELVRAAGVPVGSPGTRARTPQPVSA